MLRLELGHRELPLVLGGTAFLDLGQLLEDDLLDAREILGFQLGADREDAAAHEGGVAHG